ncbi:zinc-finger of the MIZ type in Nse subunit-domain-containing protein [Aspergillus taichungensis]|uniref:Zinc-finger of the MIZ type in Nse subunit-domain-containing protein n=1 Tax=Aspergillus taichungensis TaxID=482145 RepID=A0A2J5HWY0_9EURO|nr:zinc-finger of the MIZ type in Nse subunit-domain-containing protein [Aspergillus taichungensis]
MPPRRRQPQEEQQEEETFTYEPPLKTLNSTGHRALLQLLKSQPLRHLKTHLQHAEEKLTDAAGEVNERLTDAHVRYQRLKERRGSSTRDQDADGEDAAAAAAAAVAEGGDDNDEDGEKARVARLEEDVMRITGRLEVQMRKTIDAEAMVDGLGVVLGRFEDEAERESIAAPGAPVSASTRGRRGRIDEEEEGGEEEEEEEEEKQDFVPTSQKLADELEEDHTKWDELSPTERYSTNNAYIGFYRIIHEAKHPGNDIPPLPPSSTWFTHLEPASQSHRKTSPSQPQSQSQSRTHTRPHSPAPSTTSTTSSDLAISSEIISLNCPLTLLPFQNPVTSTKCPHSFEREAIESMLSQSQTTVAVSAATSAGSSRGGRKGRRVRAVKCPVCSVLLTGDDLRADAVLVRRVKRAEAARRREEEEGDSEGDYGVVGGEGSRKRARRSEITVRSDDEEEEEEEEDREQQVVRIKQERFVSQG